MRSGIISLITFTFFWLLFNLEFFSYDLEILVAAALLITIWLLTNILKQFLSVSLYSEMEDIYIKFVKLSESQLNLISKFLKLWNNFKNLELTLIGSYLESKPYIDDYCKRNYSSLLIYFSLFFNKGLINFSTLLIITKEYTNNLKTQWSTALANNNLNKIFKNSNKVIEETFYNNKINFLFLSEKNLFHLKLAYILSYRFNISLKFFIYCWLVDKTSNTKSVN